MQILIRESTENDTIQLEYLFQNVRKRTFNWKNKKIFLLKDYRNYVLDEKVYVAEVEGKIIGFISFYEPENFVHNLYVYPEFQSFGAGRLLLNKIIKIANNSITLKVDLLNKKAQLFYEKFGFKKISTHENEKIPYILYKYDL